MAIASFRPSSRASALMRCQCTILPKSVPMPLRYFIDKERRLVTTTAWGDVGFEETKAHQDRLVNDPEFDPEFNQLIDASGITALHMSIQEARIVASQPIFSATSRRAVVATDPFIFGMARLMEAYHSIARLQSPVNVFYDLEKAYEWLGLKDDPGPRR